MQQMFILVLCHPNSWIKWRRRYSCVDTIAYKCVTIQPCIHILLTSLCRCRCKQHGAVLPFIKQPFTTLLQCSSLLHCCNITIPYIANCIKWFSNYRVKLKRYVIPNFICCNLIWNAENWQLFVVIYFAMLHICPKIEYLLLCMQFILYIYSEGYTGSTMIMATHIL